MQKTQVLGRFAYPLRVAAIATALVMLGVAGPASAGNVLFQISTSTCNLNFPDCGGRYLKATGTVSGQTLMTTMTVSGGANFTIPSRIFSSTGSFTATLPPVYPFFKGSYNRYNKGGALINGNWSPGAVYTFIDKDTQYPIATTPANGFVRAKVGPNGVAGPNSMFASTYYTFTLVSGGAIFDATFLVLNTGGGPLSTNPNRAGRSLGTNTSNGSQNGIVVWVEPNIWNFTGTLTVSQPPPFGPTFYQILTGMDDRTASGASGTIQTVTAAIATNYNVTPLPAPMDGTATVTNYRNAFAGARQWTIQLLPTPEPGQIALLGLGVAGLAGLWRMRRRG